MKAKKARVAAVAALILMCPVASHAAIKLLDKDDWKISFIGLLEADYFSDSTRSLAEIIGDGPVARPDNINGQTGRMQFSIRNSKFGVQVEAPQVATWKALGFVNCDFFGYNPVAGTLISEAASSNNATVRLFIGYLQADSENWRIMAGLNWSGLGWQPNYFMNTVTVIPSPGMLMNRTTQARVTRTIPLESGDRVQVMFDVVRPPQRDAKVPGLQAGVRYALDSRKGGFTPTPVGDEITQSASVALTGDLRQFVTPKNPTNPDGNLSRFMGEAVAVDMMIPVIPSKDGKDVSNTFTIEGEFSMGTGYGDEFVNWTGNLANPLNSSTTAPNNTVNLDGGLGDFDTAGNFHLVDLKTFNVTGEYHFDARTRTWMNIGYGRIYSDNVSLLTNAAGTTSAGATTRPYNKDQIYFVNLFHDFTNQIRGGVEYSHIRTNYEANVVGIDNRYQVSGYFRF